MTRKTLVFVSVNVDDKRLNNTFFNIHTLKTVVMFINPTRGCTSGFSNLRTIMEAWKNSRRIHDRSAPPILSSYTGRWLKTVVPEIIDFFWGHFSAHRGTCDRWLRHRRQFPERQKREVNGESRKLLSYLIMFAV